MFMILVRFSFLGLGEYVTGDGLFGT